MSSVTINRPSSSFLPTEEERTAGRRKTARNAVLVALITLIGCWLRFHGLAAKPYWLDEAVSVKIARLPWKEFAAVLWRREANMAPYYLVLHIWLLLGHSEFFIRSLSVLFSVATIPVIYLLASRLWNSSVGLLSAFLLSINAFHIRYAQEARAYSLVMLCATLATWLLVRNLQGPQRPLWGTYSAVSALTVYCHFYGALVIVAHGISLFFRGRGNVPWKSILRSLLWFSLLMVPIAIFVVRVGSQPLSWIHPITLPMLLGLGFDFSGNFGPWLLSLTVLAAGAFLLRAAHIWHARRAVEVWRYSLVFAWLCVPISIVVFASVLFRPLLVPRFLSPCMPALTILVAAGIAESRPRLPASLVLIAIVLCSIAGTVAYYHADFDVVRAHWRTASRFIISRTKPGDTIFFYQAIGSPPFEYYKWLYSPKSPWPKELNPDYGADLASSGCVPIPGTHLCSRPAGNRVWLVWYRLVKPDGNPDTSGYKIRDWFATGRHRIAARMFMGVSVTLYARNTSNQTSQPY